MSAPPPGSLPGLLGPSDPPPPAAASRYPGDPLECDRMRLVIGGECPLCVCGHAAVGRPGVNTQGSSACPSGRPAVRSAGRLTAAGQGSASAPRTVPCFEARALSGTKPGPPGCVEALGYVSVHISPAWSLVPRPLLHPAFISTSSAPMSSPCWVLIVTQVSVDVIFSKDPQLLMSPPTCGPAPP